MNDVWDNRIPSDTEHIVQDSDTRTIGINQDAGNSFEARL